VYKIKMIQGKKNKNQKQNLGLELMNDRISNEEILKFNSFRF